MEFRRFGSIISGSYWGCCAICIIQNFKVNPDAPASIQMVHGDSGAPIGGKFAGKTYREMFETLIRTGTFNTVDMPNHAFLASLTAGQLRTDYGKAWLKILKEHGFEFIRTVTNSVYSGPNILKDVTKRVDREGNAVYIFGLFRNIGEGAQVDPFLPPKEWMSLPKVIPEAMDCFADEAGGKRLLQIATEQAVGHKKIWDAGVTKFYSEKELREANVPVTLSGTIGEGPKVKATDAPKSKPVFAYLNL